MIRCVISIISGSTEHTPSIVRKIWFSELKKNSPHLQSSKFQAIRRATHYKSRIRSIKGKKRVFRELRLAILKLVYDANFTSVGCACAFLHIRGKLSTSGVCLPVGGRPHDHWRNAVLYLPQLCREADRRLLRRKVYSDPEGRLSAEVGSSRAAAEAAHTEGLWLLPAAKSCQWFLPVGADPDGRGNKSRILPPNWQGPAVPAGIHSREIWALSCKHLSHSNLRLHDWKKIIIFPVFSFLPSFVLKDWARSNQSPAPKEKKKN